MLAAMAIRAHLGSREWMPSYKSYRNFLTTFGLAVKKDEDKESSRKQAEAVQLQWELMIKLCDLFGYSIDKKTGKVKFGRRKVDHRCIFNADETMLQLYRAAAGVISSKELGRVNENRPEWNKKTATLLPIVTAAGTLAVCMLIFYAGVEVIKKEREASAAAAYRADEASAKAEEHLHAAAKQLRQAQQKSTRKRRTTREPSSGAGAGYSPMDEDCSGTAASSSSSAAAAAALTPVQQLVRDFESVQERVAAYGGVPSLDTQADLLSLQRALRARQEGEAYARKADRAISDEYISLIVKIAQDRYMTKCNIKAGFRKA